MRARRLLEKVDATPEYLADVEKLLERTLANPERSVFVGGPLQQAARHLTLGAGGKRIRPLLAFLFARAVGVRGVDVVTIGTSAELVHSASLLHDDVVDAGMFRRSRPTVNAQWGNITAVMAGDMLLVSAIRLLESLDRRITQEAVRTVDEMTRATMAEVEARNDLDVPIDRFRAICEGKTGSLFAYCGSAAAILGDDKDAQSRFSAFARHLGVAFQFADDVLDLTGQDAKKPQYADLRSRTPSLPVLIAAKDASLRRSIRDLWGFGSMSDERVREVGEAILASGAVGTAAKKVNAEIALAQDALRPLSSRVGVDELLSWATQLADSVETGGSR
ncbi:MAG: polyprenyl synthetase family protein [Myxococcaceae bacterium]